MPVIVVFQASVTRDINAGETIDNDYEIPIEGRDKVASPRGFEPLYSP